MYYRKFVIIICLILASAGAISFCKEDRQPVQQVLQSYDTQLDTLIRSIALMGKALNATTSQITLKQHYRRCRLQYKQISFILQYVDGRSARLLNGPDLLRIDEENPGDSMVPHGFQVMERCLYIGTRVDKDALEKELVFTYNLLLKLRNDDDRMYQFTDANVWTAMRTGVYGIIALDITGFDASLSKESIPGALAQLNSIRNILGYYKNNQEGKLDQDVTKALLCTRRATEYLQVHRSFGSPEPLILIKNFLNPLSESLSAIALKRGYYNAGETTPLNLRAVNLFARDVFNPLFFSANDQFLPTPSRVKLGRRLFFDVSLSGDRSRSCGSCHRPELAFTDGLVKPLKMNGGKLLRNTPTLLNSSLQTRQFYDMRMDKLETQLSDVVHNEDEMGGSLLNAAGLLKKDAGYMRAFLEAYPEVKDPFNAYSIANAISNYVRSLTSFNAPFDRYMRGETITYSLAAKRGFNLFMGKAACGTCHYAPLFNGLVPPLYGDTEAEILGVPSSKIRRAGIDEDEGRARFTKLSIHRYSFKTPTLRNVAITAPYMHNGVFATLDEVLEFYNKGGGAGLGINGIHQSLPTSKLNLSAQDKKDIIAFLKTLTDTSSAQ